MSDETFFGSLFVGAACFFVILFIGIIWVSELECHAAWEGSGRPVKWQVFGGCMVNDGKGWLPAKNYRAL